MTGKQLKNSILQWAIQGKLVPQDPNDEPASVLLEKIRQEKERLIKEKKIKRDKNASIIFRGEDNSYYEKFLTTGEVKCIDEEIRFDLPDTWQWCRIGSLFMHNNGKQLNKGNTKGKLMEYITTSNLYWDGFLLEDLKKMPFEDGEIERCMAVKGDLLVCEGGDIGRSCIWNYDFPIMLQNHIHKLRPFVTICIEYFYYIFYCYNMAGWIGGKGIGIQGFSSKALHNTLVPLPPLQEQQRIVLKIREVLPYVDKYAHSQDAHNHLNQSIRPLLRKSILQEAVQGRLVPQIAEEGTARELLEQIRQEKQKLVEEGKLKKTALTDSIIYKGDDNRYYEKIDQQCKDITEEIPFEIPENWEWARLSSIVRMTMGKTPPRGEQSYWNNGIYPWVSISDMYEGGITSETKEKVSEYAANNLFSAISPKGSLLMSFKLTVGRTTILGIDAYHNEAIITILPYLSNDNIMKMYLFKLLPILSTNGDSKDAIKGKTLNSKSLANLLIPLPPLQEQQRIVAQIERLFEQLK